MKTITALAVAAALAIAASPAFAEPTAAPEAEMTAQQKIEATCQEHNPTDAAAYEACVNEALAASEAPAKDE